MAASKTPLHTESSEPRPVNCCMKAKFTHDDQRAARAQPDHLRMQRRVARLQPQHAHERYRHARRPSQLDYFWVIPSPYPEDPRRMPGRPIPLKESSIDLSHYHVAKLEHVPYTYRLYHYGPEARGVFRGEPEASRILVTEPIPIEDEHPRFRGFLVFNEDEYAQGVKRWENYWTWIKNRNEARWISQEAGQVDYDLKNMMHCLRLLLSRESILRTGEPRVKFTGPDREFLMDV